MKKHKLLRRLAPVLLITLLLVCALPALPVSAAVNTVAVETEKQLRNALEEDGRTVILANDLELSKCLTIEKTVTLDLDGNKLYRKLSSRQDDGHVIEVIGNGTVTVQNGTVSGGYATHGGGILNNGRLMLKNVTVTGNKAFDGGGILNHSMIDIDKCTLKDNKSQNGGGGNLWSDGTLAILRNTTVSGGTAQNGGGIANHGKMTLDGCTVTGNTATNKGGGVFNNGYIETATLELWGNNTIQSNIAVSKGGGVYVAPNGIGTISVRGKPVIKDNKKGKSDSNVYLCGLKKIYINGELHKDSKIYFEIENKNGCITENLAFASNTDVFFSDTGAAVQPVKLLDMYGDETTELQQGSYIAFVSKGYKEANGVYTPNVSPSTENVCYDFPTALKKAADYIAGGATPLIILCDDAEVSDSVTVDETLDKTVLDLNGYTLRRVGANQSVGGELFHIKKGVLTIEDTAPKRRPNTRGKTEPRGGILTGGSSSGDGGCIVVDEEGTLRLLGGTVRQNVCTGNGGAICSKGQLTVKGASFLENTADGNGGAIYYAGGVCTIQNSTLSQNRAKSGGAVYNDSFTSGGGLTIGNCTLRNNTASADGGAVALGQKVNRTYIAGSVLSENSSGGKGGAVFAPFHDVIFADCDIQDNSAESGGGVYVTEGNYITLQGKMTVTNNQNSATSRQENVALAFAKSSNQAYIVSAGLSNGSHIGLSRISTKNAAPTNMILVVKNVTDYQRVYYYADDGELSFQKTGDRTEIYMATSIRPFGMAIYPLIGMELIIGAAVLIRARMQKKEKVKVKVQAEEERL